ncbi:MAG: hypothetical protein H6557_26140 [Lewinellaceae bacterium]|nr:hypothetical protein [Phaeodactylibacter sp.]MCB9040118.1 hypothetical protein [Lewinellaceae bacterium]
MYQHHTTPFGKYEAHSLANEAAGNRITLVPGFGSCVLNIELQGQPVLDGYTSAEEMNINRWAKNVLLFPFPNRLREGLYQWGGREYAFPVNDGQTGNALHGFGMDKPMEVVKVETGEREAAIRCAFRYDGRLSHYPFPFAFEAAFRIADPATIEIAFQAHNTGGEPLPFGMGWHPYFRLSERVDDLAMQLPPCDMIGVDQVMIPTGKHYEYTTFTQLRRIGPEVLDNCFVLRQQEGQVEITLRGEKGELAYRQDVGPGKFGYLQLFTPPHRNALALEPMSCNIDAFNSGEGLIRLEPGESASASFGFSFNKRQ